MWQAMIWILGYFIWKERNARVFKGKASSLNKILQDIQLKSYEWIARRSGKKSGINWQQWLFDPFDSLQFHVWHLGKSAHVSIWDSLLIVSTWEHLADMLSVMFGIVGKSAHVSIWDSLLIAPLF
nr:transposon TX1 [Tanacetum cinerariifolium]